MTSKCLYKDKTTTILLKDGIITKIYSSSIEHEAEIQKLAADLNIAPKVYSVKDCVMEMEYIEGYDLDRYLKLPGINRPILKTLIRTAINKLYDNGIKHNDLTGKNVMITKSGGIKIIDYGHSVLSKESIPKNQRDYGILKNF